MDAIRPLKREDLTPEFLRDFWAQVDKTGDCWLWAGELGTKGYGRIHVPGFGTQSTHRVSYVIDKGGPIPFGMQVLHECDVRTCCRPDHLWLGTNAQNHADKIRKGRQSATLGEQCGKAKLSEPEATAIYRLKTAGIGNEVLASAFGVCVGTVSKISAGERWPHVALAEHSTGPTLPVDGLADRVAARAESESAGLGSYPRMITVRLTPELHERVKATAHEQRMSMNALCLASLEHAVESLK